MERAESCDLCEASLRDGELVAGLNDQPLVRCRGCGLVVTSPRPTADELPSHYEEGYYAHVAPATSRRDRVVAKLKEYRGGYPAKDPVLVRGGWRFGAALLGGVFLTNLPHRGPGKKLLDIGCGSGKTLRWAEERGWEVYGVEWSPAAVEHARRSGLDQVRQGAVETQSYPGAFFDAITMYQVLEHVYSPTSVLREANRILKDDGSVWVSVPNFASFPRWMLGGAWHGLQIPIHLYHFTPATLRRAAETAGFRVVEERYYSRVVTTYTTAAGFAARLSRASTVRGALSATCESLAALRAARAAPGVRFSDIMQVELRKAPQSGGTEG